MILKSLSLTNFRQFDSRSLSFDKPWTIIVAPNAGGKSSILEALYMLSHGESPWESNHVHIMKLHSDSNSTDSEYKKLTESTARIEATITEADETVSLALSFSTRNGVTTKQYLVDGKSTTRNRFLSRFHTVLFSPDLIDLLMYEPSQRRNFLDFYAEYLLPDIGDLRLNYKKVLRHRNSILKSIAAQRFYGSYPQSNPQSEDNSGSEQSGTNGNGSMLEYWTSQLIDIGSRIIDFRLQLIEKLNACSSNYPTTITYLPTIPLNDLSEMATLPHIKDLFFDRIEKVQEKEKLAGKTLVGPHRDDWFLSVHDENINRYGSRGEKRLAIADIIFKLDDILKSTFDTPPILLLDDISSELDSDNIDLVFKKKIAKNQQSIITSTSIADIPVSIRRSIHTIEL